jgi:hypothetical protein
VTVVSPEKATPTSRRRWLIVVGVAWGLFVLAAGVWGVSHDKPTAREQTTIAQALPVVDTAVAKVVAAAQSPSTVTVIGGYSQMSADCRVTTARSGARYERSALFYTSPGTEAGLMDRIAAGLPKSYHVLLHRLGNAASTLYADAGTFVAVRGLIPEPGVVQVSADTGCRPKDRPVTELEPAAPADLRSSAEAVFTALGVTASGWHMYRLSCPDGPVWTVEGIGAPAPASLRDTLKDQAVVSRDDLVAYRNGPVGVAVRATSGEVIVAATSGC